MCVNVNCIDTLFVLIILCDNYYLLKKIHDSRLKLLFLKFEALSSKIDYLFL